MKHGLDKLVSKMTGNSFTEVVTSIRAISPTMFRSTSFCTAEGLQPHDDAKNIHGAASKTHDISEVASLASYASANYLICRFTEHCSRSEL